jgi:hypothetical protein
VVTNPPRSLKIIKLWEFLTGIKDNYMSANIVLKHLRKVDQLTKKISSLSSDIKCNNKDFTWSKPNEIYSLKEQLVIMKVYLEEAISELEWSQKIKSRIKEELSLMVITFSLVILVVFFIHWFF